MNLDDPSDSQRLWASACEAVIEKLRAHGVALDNVHCVPLHEAKSINQVKPAGPWGAAVAQGGLESFAAMSRVSRRDARGEHAQNLLICLFRDPVAGESQAFDDCMSSAGADIGVNASREFWVAHELAHAHQELNGFEWVREPLVKLGGELAEPALRALDQFRMDPSADPRPKEVAALELAMIFEEFYSDVLACKLGESAEAPASTLARGAGMFRQSRSMVESGRYQHGGLLVEFSKRPVDGLDWSSYAMRARSFCVERAPDFLRSSQALPLQINEAMELAKWRGSRSPEAQAAHAKPAM